ncbi:MAG: hypothetical protein H0V29_12685, partial [Thermoleophilaceae bacterium]|nr:hypothetical protein [Thermoleophilaceae bacterium]
MTIRRFILPVLFALSLALAACGGGGDSDSAKETVDKAFKNSIGSANVKLDVTVQLNGIPQLSDPVKVQLKGPYKSNGDKKIPSVDWDVNFSGGGQNIEAGLVSTGDNAYVEFGGQAFQVGEEQVATLNKQIADQAGKNQGTSLADLGIEPTSWLSDAKDEGEADVGGEQATHVSSQVDVAKMVTDLNEVVDKAPAATTGGQKPPKITEAQIKKITDVVKEPRLDVFVGDDDKLRKVAMDIEFDVPEGDRKASGGIESGKIAFAIEFTKVGEDQDIKAPENAKPINELGGALQGILGGAAGGLQGGSGGAGAAPAPATPD